MRLAKEGYGSIDELKKLDVKTFIDLIHYENFINKYQQVLSDLNRKD